MCNLAIADSRVVYCIMYCVLSCSTSTHALLQHTARWALCHVSRHLYPSTATPVSQLILDNAQHFVSNSDYCILYCWVTNAQRQKSDYLVKFCTLFSPKVSKGQGSVFNARRPLPLLSYGGCFCFSCIHLIFACVTLTWPTTNAVLWY